MRNRRYMLIIILIALLLDWYVFQAVKAIAHGASPRWKLVIYGVYWGITLLALGLFPLLPIIQVQSHRLYNYLFSVFFGLYIAKLLAAVFFLFDDIRRVIQWAVVHASNRPKPLTGEGMPRSVFLSWLGLALGGSVFSSLLYGFTNKYNYRVRRLQLAYANLPAGFKGIKIVQLSDIHTGSLSDPAAVNKGIDMVLAEAPDLILFTGDLVNDQAVEMTEDYRAIFARLKAPMGVYSTLGNHDYGDYSWWETPELKKANLERIKQIQGEMGWRLLMNEHVALERGGDQIALIGIENWSAKARFPKYGKLDSAYAGTEKYPFKILMSHDPSHWDAEVRPHYPDIDLALAGHTHGMQFGVELPWMKWSPVQYVYKEWAGLYEEGKQKLYVNRGFGFIGYPGRFGILPEITVFELV